MSEPRELNVERLIRVRDQFLASPESLRLDDDYVSGIHNASGVTMCFAGAAALDAGFIQLRTSPRPGTERVLYDVTPAGAQYCDGVWTAEMFRTALGVDRHQSDRLFFVGNWPKGYRTQFESATTPVARARVAGRRIDHFIETRGRE